MDYLVQLFKMFERQCLIVKRNEEILSDTRDKQNCNIKTTTNKQQNNLQTQNIFRHLAFVVVDTMLGQLMLEGSSLTTLLLMEWLLLLPFAFSFCVCIVTCGGQKKQQPPPGKQQKPPTLQSPSNPPKRQFLFYEILFKKIIFLPIFFS